MIYKLPGNLNFYSSTATLNDLCGTLQGEDDLTIDFSNLSKNYSFSYPIGTLIIGSGLRNLIKKRKDEGLLTTYCGTKKTGALSYLSFIGFFDFINLPSEGEEIGYAKGSSNYIPIETISKSDFQHLVSPHVTLKQLLSEKTWKIAEVISGTNDKNINSTLSYSIREIVRNVFEHSGEECCHLAAQRWGENVQFCILDEGIGIKKSLEGSHAVIDDREAITLAIEPGLSRIPDTTRENPYDNSGFGLYVLSRLGSEYGAFTVGSESAALKIVKGNNQNFTNNFKGTYVCLDLNKFPGDWEEQLKNIVHDGEVHAHTMGRNVIASSSSKCHF